jgi:hypothetical protein
VFWSLYLSTSAVVVVQEDHKILLSLFLLVFVITAKYRLEDSLARPFALDRFVAIRFNDNWFPFCYRGRV